MSKKNEDVVEIRGHVLKPDKQNPVQMLHFKGRVVECKHYSKRVRNPGMATILLEYWVGTLDGVTYHRLSAREASLSYGYLFNERGTNMEELLKDAEASIRRILEEQTPYELNQLKIREEEVRIQLGRLRGSLRTLKSSVLDDFILKGDKRKLTTTRKKLEALTEDV